MLEWPWWWPWDRQTTPQPHQVGELEGMQCTSPVTTRMVGEHPFLCWSVLLIWFPSLKSKKNKQGKELWWKCFFLYFQDKWSKLHRWNLPFCYSYAMYDTASISFPWVENTNAHNLYIAISTYLSINSEVTILKLFGSPDRNKYEACAALKRTWLQENIGDQNSISSVQKINFLNSFQNTGNVERIKRLFQQWMYHRHPCFLLCSAHNLTIQDSQLLLHEVKCHSLEYLFLSHCFQKILLTSVKHKHEVSPLTPSQCQHEWPGPAVPLLPSNCYALPRQGTQINGATWVCEVKHCWNEHVQPYNGERWICSSNTMQILAQQQQYQPCSTVCLWGAKINNKILY